LQETAHKKYKGYQFEDIKYVSANSRCPTSISYLKQFDQKFLSKHCQMTPSYVDKYFGKVKDATTNDGASSYMSGIESGEKDSDTVGRFNENFTVTVYLGDVVVVQTPATGVYTFANTAAGAVASTV